MTAILVVVVDVVFSLLLLLMMMKVFLMNLIDLNLNYDQYDQQFLIKIQLDQILNEKKNFFFEIYLI